MNIVLVHGPHDVVSVRSPVEPAIKHHYRSLWRKLPGVRALAKLTGVKGDAAPVGRAGHIGVVVPGAGVRCHRRSGFLVRVEVVRLPFKGVGSCGRRCQAGGEHRQELEATGSHRGGRKSRMSSIEHFSSSRNTNGERMGKRRFAAVGRSTRRNTTRPD